MAGKVDLKVVLLGKEYGGKTSLVERYIHGKFNSNAPYQSVSNLPSASHWVCPPALSYLVEYIHTDCISLQTIGAAFGAKKVSVQGESVTLGIWVSTG